MSFLASLLSAVLMKLATALFGRLSEEYKQEIAKKHNADQVKKNLEEHEKIVRAYAAAEAKGELTDAQKDEYRQEKIRLAERFNNEIHSS